jgi:hypothetical protein
VSISFRIAAEAALRVLVEYAFSQRTEIGVPEIDLPQVVVAIEPTVFDMLRAELNRGCGRATEEIGTIELA